MKPVFDGWMVHNKVKEEQSSRRCVSEMMIINEFIPLNVAFLVNICDCSLKMELARVCAEIREISCLRERMKVVSGCQLLRL